MTLSSLKHKDGTACAGAHCASVLKPEHRWAGDVVLHLDQSRHDRNGWRTMIVTANEEGFDEGPTVLASWDQYDNTRAFLDRYNAQRGYTKSMTRDVVASSMFGRTYERPSTGYICKRCGGPSPVGIGYASSDPRNTTVDECPCGHSRPTTS